MKLNTAAEKIKSERGASITFALLIFLVCAVVGSIVLSAATASAGRLNKLAESDRRYYSVSSAAELIVEALDGKEVVISGDRDDVTTTVTTYKVNADGSVEVDGPSVVTGPVSGTPGNVSLTQTGDADSLLCLATKKLVFGNNNQAASNDYFWDSTYSPGALVTNNDVISDLELSHQRGADTLSELQVDIDVKITEKRLHLILKNHASADEAVYTIELFFTPAYNTIISKSSNTQTAIDNTLMPAKFKETVTLTETYTKTTTVYWSLSEIKKGQ